MPKDSKPGFPCIYGIKNQNLGKSTLVEPRAEKSRGVDPSGTHTAIFGGDNDRRSTGIPPNLACGPRICVEVWRKV